jgi:uncharacterized membrane protein
MKKYLVAGFVALLPLILTYVIVVFGLGLITSPFENLVHFILSHLHLFDRGIGILTREQLIHFVSKICIIFSLIAFVILVGMLAQWVMFHSWGYYFDRLLRKIPVVSRVYKTSKDLVDALFLTKSDTSRKAVLVPYPSSDQLTLGISTGEYEMILHENKETFVSVLIPSTPNATAGYLVSYPKSLVTYLEMSGEEALKNVMSFKGVMK